MTGIDDLYPPSPKNVPSDLTATNAAYRLRVIFVLVGLVVFFCTYCALIWGAGFLFWNAFFGKGAQSEEAPGRSAIVLEKRIENYDAILRTADNLFRRLSGTPRDSSVVVHEIDQVVVSDLEKIRDAIASESRTVAHGGSHFDALASVVAIRIEAFKLTSKGYATSDPAVKSAASKKHGESAASFDQFALAADEFRKTRLVEPRKKTSFTIIPGDLTVTIPGVVGGIVCLFLVKGLFKRRRSDPNEVLEITAENQPELFAFIRRVCDETGAPRPRRVIVIAHVSAGVAFSESVLGLFWPTKKDLMIGLGLVHQLNLSEFKAVLAHEFGHFSQKSMRLDRYVYVANRVLEEIVYGRDQLDHFMTRVARKHLLVAVFAWAFAGVMWAIRKSLHGLYLVINLGSRALSRQKEFQADLVAVSVTGSDAVANMLKASEFAEEAFSKAVEDLVVAAEHGKRTSDLYDHQTRAAERLRQSRRDQKHDRAPSTSGDDRPFVFEAGDTTVPRMWATHPSNYDREQSAKRRYVRCEIDDRSAWILFRNADELRRKVTERSYERGAAAGKLKIEEPEEIEAFIAAERGESSFHSRYAGMYDHRFIDPGPIDGAVAAGEAEYPRESDLVKARSELFGKEFESRLAAHNACIEEISKLRAIASGSLQLRGKVFEFRGEHRPAAATESLIAIVERELAADREWMTRHDRSMFLIHHEMARRTDEALLVEFLDRYRFHETVQTTLLTMTDHRNRAHQALAALRGKTELKQSDVHPVEAALVLAQNAMAQFLAAAETISIPSLTHVTPGQTLRSYVLPGKPVPNRISSWSRLDGPWIDKVLEQLQTIISRSERLRIKSLSAILSFQDRIGAAFVRAREGREG